MRNWLSLLPHEFYPEQYESLNAFQEKYSEPLVKIDQLVGDSNEDLTPEQLVARQRELAKSTPIGLFFIDSDLITEPFAHWFDSEFSRLQELEHIDPERPPKTLILVFDSPDSVALTVRHQRIDDLLIKPLDQQLFLQKTDLHLSDRPNPQSSFLFRAQASGTVELGKEVKVEEVSDFGVSICNPSAITEGVLSRFHCQLLGDDLESSICYAKAYVSVRHPTRKGQWLVRFSLFGLSQSQLARLRQFVRAQADEHFGQTAPRAPRHHLLDRRRPKFKVAVIDPDPQSLEQIQNTLQENFERVRTVGFASFTRLLGQLAKLAQASSQDDSNASVVRSLPPIIPRDADPLTPAIQQGAITWRLDSKSFRFVAPVELRSGSELFLGRPLSEWQSGASAWTEQAYDSDAEDLNEFLGYVANGNSGTTMTRLLNKAGEVVYCELKAHLEIVHSANDSDPTREPEASIHVQFVQTDQKTWTLWNQKWMTQDQDEEANEDTYGVPGQRSKTQTADDLRFDLLIVEASLIRFPLEEWLDSLHRALVKAQVISRVDPLPQIIVMADEKSHQSVTSFAHSAISDYLFKPLDRKLLTDKVELSLPALSRTAPLMHSPYVPIQDLTGHLCKTVPMLEISEFGLAVQHGAPIKSKVFMRAFSEMLGDGPEGVLLRSVGSVQNPNPDLKVYSCYFIFFGANEELYQRIRRWIREDYAHRKEGQL